MSKLHTPVQITVELLSPLHIGTGTELLLDYDLVPHEGQTYRVDEEVLLEQALIQAEAAGGEAMNRLLAGRPAAELLTEADFADPDGPLFRYVLPGQPFTQTAGAKIKEQIKDVYDQLYLPGSSLKGAVRTLLARGLYRRRKKKPDLGRLKRSRSWAAQPLEQGLFGRNPNYDWLRALRVADSQSIPAKDHLALRTVRVFPTETRDSPGLNIDVEAAATGTVFETTITIDEYGFQPGVARRLDWEGKRKWLDQLPALAKEEARGRLLLEAEFFQAQAGPVGALRFYDELINLWDGLAKNELILQVGWGAGWESKTLGSDLIRTNDNAFERLLDQYRMTKEKNRRPGDAFPKSRHLVLSQGGQPSAPLGWLKVRLEE